MPSRILYRGFLKRNSEVPLNFNQPILIVESSRQSGLVVLPFVDGLGRANGVYRYLAKGRNKLRVPESNYRLKIVQSDAEIAVYETDEEPEPALMALINDLTYRLSLIELEIFGAPSDIQVIQWIANSGIQLNGSASIQGGVLRLTSNDNYLAGSCFFVEPITYVLNGVFNCEFQMVTDANPDGADGFALVLQNSSLGATYLGDAGGSLGFGSDTPSRQAVLNPAVAVTLKTWGDPTVSLCLNSSAGNPIASAPSPLDFNSGNPCKCWVDYDGNQISVFIAGDETKPATPVLTHAFNLFTTLGSEFRVGLSAGTGGATNIHQVLNFKFNS